MRLNECHVADDHTFFRINQNHRHAAAGHSMQQHLAQARAVGVEDLDIVRICG